MVIEFKKTTTQEATGTVAPTRLRRAAVTLSNATFEDTAPAKRSHAAEPLKMVCDIVKIQDHLVSHKRYRDNLLFIMGINVGLRCGDLLKLKVGNILTEDGTAYRDSVEIVEEKTGKVRKVYLNDSVYDAADLYFEHLGAVDINDYLFHGEGNRSKNLNIPLDVKSVERILKKVINDELGIEVHASTHCLRKTFAYHMIMTAPDRSRAIEFLMKVLGHSSPAITLAYAGITDDEMRDTYKALNLGKSPIGFWHQAAC